MTEKPVVAIMHEPVGENASPSENDVLDEAKSVNGALVSLGFKTFMFPYEERNIYGIIEKIKSSGARCVFNLVETVDKTSALCHTAAQALERNGILHTGCGARALKLTTDKLLSKTVLLSRDADTPAYFTEDGEGSFIPGERYIIKPVSEEGSEKITADSVVLSSDADALMRGIWERKRKAETQMFAEQYIDGGEYAVSLIGKCGKMRVLPPARMDFHGFSENGLPEILDYEAKWNTDSFAYRYSNRSFDVSPEIAEKISAAALLCADAFSLNGYARVDIRLGKDGRAYIIDVNANPCISPDAGFAAAAQAGGLTYDRAVYEIVVSAYGRSK